MDKNQIMNLKIRLGYSESITLSRDEFNEIMDDDPFDIANLKEEVEDLVSDIEALKDEILAWGNENEELELKIEKLEKEIKELKESK